MQFEGEVKGLKEFLSVTRAVVSRVQEKEPSYHEVTWVKLREVGPMPGGGGGGGGGWGKQRRAH